MEIKDSSSSAYTKSLFCSYLEFKKFIIYTKFINEYDNIIWGMHADDALYNEHFDGEFPLTDRELIIAEEFINLYK